MSQDQVINTHKKISHDIDSSQNKRVMEKYKVCWKQLSCTVVLFTVLDKEKEKHNVSLISILTLLVTSLFPWLWSRVMVVHSAQEGPLQFVSGEILT